MVKWGTRALCYPEGPSREVHYVDQRGCDWSSPLSLLKVRGHVHPLCVTPLRLHQTHPHPFAKGMGMHPKQAKSTLLTGFVWELGLTVE